MSDQTVYRPNLSQFRKLAVHHNLITVVREFAADLDTPVTVYVKLMEQMGPSFLLESVEGGEKVGRYSFVGLNPREVIELRGRQIVRTKDGEKTVRDLGADEDVLDVLKREVGGYRPAEIPGHPRFIGGAVGYLSYDTVRFYEDRIPSTAEDVLDFPEAVFLIADLIVAFDHVRHRLMIMSNARVGDDVDAAYLEAIANIERVTERLLRPLPSVPRRIWSRTGKIDRALRSNKTQPEFEQMVLTAKEHIAAGDAFQIVLSQRLERDTDAHPFQIYRALAHNLHQAFGRACACPQSAEQTQSRLLVAPSPLG